MNRVKATFFTDSPDLEFNLLGKFGTEDVAHNFVIEFISNEYCHYKPKQYHWLRNKNVWSNGFDVIKIESCSEGNKTEIF